MAKGKYQLVVQLTKLLDAPFSQLLPTHFFPFWTSWCYSCWKPMLNQKKEWLIENIQCINADFISKNRQIHLRSENDSVSSLTMQDFHSSFPCPSPSAGWEWLRTWPNMWTSTAASRAAYSSCTRRWHLFISDLPIWRTDQTSKHVRSWNSTIFE